MICNPLAKENNNKTMNARYIIGEKFGKLTIIGEYINDLDERVVRIVCDCGTHKEIIRGNIISGNTKSCGCIRYGEIVGKKFTMLTIIDEYESDLNYKMVHAICDCGTHIHVRRNNIISRHTKSCGCLRLKKNKTNNYERKFDQRAG